MNNKDIVMYSVVATLALVAVIIVNYICGASVHNHTFLLLSTNVVFGGIILVMAINIVNEVWNRV